MEGNPLRIWFRRSFALIAGLMLVAVGTSAASAQPSEPSPPAVTATASTPGFARGHAALDRLGNRMDAVAAGYGLSRAELRSMFLADSTLAVDGRLELAYFDVLGPGETAAEAATAVGFEPITGEGSQFELASLPGADQTIYLDFDGHVTTGTSWNGGYGVDVINSPPYDTNGDPTTFTSGERSVIERSWAVVAEDFAPWNINVTTVDPGAEALRYSGSGDTRWGIRVVITADTFANCGCGGHAYIGSFDDTTDEPTFVYNTSFVGVSEAISHEVGHAMLLAHDGNAGSSYYTGHGSGETSWAPIMGVGYYVNVSQWSRQEYYGANNNTDSANYGNGRDDVAIISSLTNGNGFGLRLDDHGDNAASAGIIAPSPEVNTGIIGTRTDVDTFLFATEGGTAEFTATPASQGANLDIALTVRDSAGTVVGSADNPATLASSLTLSLPAGTYSIEVDGAGVDDPGADPPSGYTDYGSLGAYTLVAAFDAAPPPPPPPPPPPDPDPSSSSADGELPVAGNAVGDYTATVATDGVVQTITESESGGKRNLRHDLLEHRWSIPAPDGVQTLTVAGAVTDGGDDDDGISIEWSTDGSSWIQLGVVRGTFTESYLLGSPTGTVWVRVVDTDRGRGQRRFDSVAVDLLRIDGEPAGEPAAAVVSSMTVSTVSAGRGSSYGRVSIEIGDDLGQPVPGADVTVSFRGDFSDAKTVTTDSLGRAVFTTTTAVRKPAFEVCVANVVATGLNYASGEICRSG